MFKKKKKINKIKLTIEKKKSILRIEFLLLKKETIIKKKIQIIEIIKTILINVFEIFKWLNQKIWKSNLRKYIYICK